MEELLVEGFIKLAVGENCLYKLGTIENFFKPITLANLLAIPLLPVSPILLFGALSTAYAAFNSSYCLWNG